jgi:hypothetical protein
MTTNWFDLNSYPICEKLWNELTEKSKQNDPTSIHNKNNKTDFIELHFYGKIISQKKHVKEI